MLLPTDDQRIANIKELLPPIALLERFPATKGVIETVLEARQSIHRQLAGDDPRLLVIVGPCSIHDPKAAIDYARRLKPLRDKFADSLNIVMRVYFEKPRTTVGWKGLINDPLLDGSCHINEGLRRARKLLIDINSLGLPTAGEFLDMITPQYIADLMSWGAIGARTTESQVHRELASGLSCPVGFKNGTDGNIKIAVDAIGAASSSHQFLSVTKFGHSAIVETAGNADCHLILRGGKAPNYDAESVASVCTQLESSGQNPRLMIDLSHANSCKQYQKQLEVGANVATQIANGNRNIFGVMIESFIEAGNQQLQATEQLQYGKSVTDGCLSWTQSEKLLAQLADAASTRQSL